MAHPDFKVLVSAKANAFIFWGVEMEAKLMGEKIVSATFEIRAPSAELRADLIGSVNEGACRKGDGMSINCATFWIVHLTDNSLGHHNALKFSASHGYAVALKVGNENFGTIDQTLTFGNWPIAEPWCLPLDKGKLVDETDLATVSFDNDYET